jgi:hypothetical protein
VYVVAGIRRVLMTGHDHVPVFERDLAVSAEDIAALPPTARPCPAAPTSPHTGSIRA